MGCCIGGSYVSKKLEFNDEGIASKEEEFNDISLSSDSEIPAVQIEEWRVYRESGSKSLTDSMGMMSTLLQSERKVSFYSKPGSIVDSFVVSVPVNINSIKYT